jgi:hypothetical protein
MNGSKVIDTCSIRVSAREMMGKRYRIYLAAHWTYKCAPILSLEKVHNHTVISFHIPLPARPSQFHEFKVAPTMPIWFFDVRLLEDAVEVLM